MLSLPDFKEKSVLIIYAKDYHLKFSNENLLMEEKKGGKTINQVSCHKLFVVMIIGTTTFSSVLLEKAQSFGFTIVFIKNNFSVYATLGSQTEGNTLLRKRQYLLMEEHLIAEHIVKNKILSQLSLLKNIRKKSDNLKVDIKKIEHLKLQIGTEKSASNDQLLGIEGNVSKLYFKHQFQDQGWKARRPRTRFDPLNTVLDSGYTVLFNFIEAHLRIYGFDIYQGIYHRQFYQRKSLVCDLVEPFRPLIDKAVKSAFNLNKFQDSDFELINQQYQLKINERRKYTSVFAECLLSEKEAIFTYIQQYYRAFIRNKDLTSYPIYNLCSSSVTTSQATKHDLNLADT